MLLLCAGRIKNNRQLSIMHAVFPEQFKTVPGQKQGSALIGSVYRECTKTDEIFCGISPIDTGRRDAYNCE